MAIGCHHPGVNLRILRSTGPLSGRKIQVSNLARWLFQLRWTHQGDRQSIFRLFEQLNGHRCPFDKADLCHHGLPLFGCFESAGWCKDLLTRLEATLFRDWLRGSRQALPLLRPSVPNCLPSTASYSQSRSSCSSYLLLLVCLPFFSLPLTSFCSGSRSQVEVSATVPFAIAEAKVHPSSSAQNTMFHVSKMGSWALTTKNHKPCKPCSYHMLSQLFLKPRFGHGSFESCGAIDRCRKMESWRRHCASVNRKQQRCENHG